MRRAPRRPLSLRPLMIDQIASSAAITLLNRMLAREQWARDRLAPFAGRSARFDATPFGMTLQVTDGGTFALADTAEPAVTIGVTLSSLPFAMLDPQAAMKEIGRASCREREEKQGGGATVKEKSYK